MQRLMLGEAAEDAEKFLEELFKVRSELLAIRTIAVHSRTTYDRMAKIAGFLSEAESTVVADLADRFDQVADTADGQRSSCTGDRILPDPVPVTT